MTLEALLDSKRAPVQSVTKSLLYVILEAAISLALACRACYSHQTSEGGEQRMRNKNNYSMAVI